ncbi:MAG: amidohydrolase [Eubacteriales bacterium]|nr:amidohydrolase [Eubacteriales bacterium]
MKELEKTLLELFLQLHAHPELGFEERASTAAIREILVREGVEILDSGLETGLVAQITGALPGPVIGLRGDIDALPIQEETNLPYASEVPGRMHACGHDAHAAIMLGAAILLHRHRDRLRGSVKLVFQPAEEIASGARRVLETGALDDAALFLAVHTYPAFPVGVLGIKEGPVMAAVDRFEIHIRGRGAHAAHPHKGVDPVVIQAAIVLGAQSIVSRALDPFAPAVVSITHTQSGNTWNVIPETAYLEGTVRTLDPAARATVRARLDALVQQTALAYGAEAELAWHPGPPAVLNDPGLCSEARAVARELGFRVDRQEDTLGGEDFSYFLQDRPGIFIRVGSGGDYPSHHPRFTVDPAAIYPAAEYFAQLAERLLNKGA